MKKHVLLISLLLTLAFTQTNCSLFSSGANEETESAAVSDDATANADGDEFASDDFEGGDDTAFDPEAMAKDEPSEMEDEFASTDVEAEDNFDTEEGSGVDNYPDDSYNEQAAAPEAAAPAAPEEDASSEYIDDNSFASEDYVAVDEGGGLPDSTMQANQEEELFGQEDEPVVDTPSFAQNNFSSFDDGGVTEAPQTVSVKKMKPAAYAMAGANINRLYIVRPGDNMEAISQKLYGEDRSQDLYKYNPSFCR